MINLIMAFHHDMKTKENIIGKDNDLPWDKNAEYCKKDLLRFKSITNGKTVVMGKNTYYSIGKPLKGRRNIVITNDKSIPLEHATISEIRAMSESGAELYIIGGKSLYEEFKDEYKNLHFTNIHPKDEIITGDVILGDWIMKEVYENPSFDIIRYEAEDDMSYTHFRRAK